MISCMVFAGLGAVGSIYARMATVSGKVECFAVVADPSSYKTRPVEINGDRLDIRLVKREDIRQTADLLIIAVKWHHLLKTLEEVAPCVRQGTVILSLLNGVESEAVIERRFPGAIVLRSYCSGVDSNRVGRSVHMNRCGKIVFGDPSGRQTETIAQVSEAFARTGIPFEAVSDIERQMWWKLMVNAGMNQVSAVNGLTYGEFRENPEAMDRMHRVQREVIAVANAQGIPMDESDILKWDWQLATLSAGGFSSTLQDVRSRRKTEVEIYGGEICRLGRLYHVDTPENERLYAEIRAMERRYLDESDSI